MSDAMADAMSDPLFSLRAKSIGRTTHTVGTAGAHFRYIMRPDAVTNIVARGIHTTVGKAVAWINAEELADRVNARVADTVIVALPHMLSPTQRLQLVCDFSDEMSNGARYIACLHRPPPGGDPRNHHAHLVFRDRHPVTGKRVMRSTDPDFIDRLTATWERHVNRAMETAGLDGRTDRRSYAERGIDRIPQIHVGPTATATARKAAHGSAVRMELPSVAKVVRNGAGHTVRTRVVDYPTIDGRGTRADENRRRAAANAARERAAADLAATEKTDQMRALAARLGFDQTAPAPSTSAAMAMRLAMAARAPVQPAASVEPPAPVRAADAAPSRGLVIAKDLAMRVQPMPAPGVSADLPTPDVAADPVAREAEILRDREAAAEAWRRRQAAADRAVEAALYRSGVRFALIWDEDASGITPGMAARLRGPDDAGRATAPPAARGAVTAVQPAVAAPIAAPPVQLPQPPTPEVALPPVTSDAPAAPARAPGLATGPAPAAPAPAPAAAEAADEIRIPRTASGGGVHYYVTRDSVVHPAGIAKILDGLAETRGTTRAERLFEAPAATEGGTPTVWMRLSVSLQKLLSAARRLAAIPGQLRALQERLWPAAEASDAAYDVIILPWERVQAREAEEEAARAAATKADQLAKDDAIRAGHAAAAAARPSGQAKGKAPKTGGGFKGPRLPPGMPKPKPPSVEQVAWVKAQRAAERERLARDGVEAAAAAPAPVAPVVAPPPTPATVKAPPRPATGKSKVPGGRGGRGGAGGIGE